MGRKKHFKKGRKKREGWFMKGDGNPDKYQSVWKGAKNGYEGVRSEVHHVVPQTSVDTSVGSYDDAKKTDYLEVVKWVTPWNINHIHNLIGLPNIHGYMQAAENVAELSETANGIEKLNEYAAWHNAMMKETTRETNVDRFLNQSPEGYAIHTPTSWGHAKYNQKVSRRLCKEIWDTLQENKKKHEENPEKVDAQLKVISKSEFGKLKGRKKATVESWLIKNRSGKKSWYEPFLMDKSAKNPLG